MERPHTVHASPDAPRADLPPAARRWLGHAVRPGSERFRHADLLMHGEIRIGRWRPFGARQILDPGMAFTWAATAGRGPLAIRGWDRYADGAGAMRWTVLGVPVMRASGPDVTRSAAGRLAGETILSPAFALDPAVSWAPGGDDGHAVFRVRVGPWEHEVTIAVDGAGGLVAVEMPRWGDPRGEGFGMHRFHVGCEGGVTHMGITVPRVLCAGWRDPDGTLREFFHATIDAATFR
jgi:hypothetical protein